MQEMNGRVSRATWTALTGRERDVVRCIVQGLSNAARAERLAVTVATIKSHKTRPRRKLGLAAINGAGGGPWPRQGVQALWSRALPGLVARPVAGGGRGPARPAREAVPTGRHGPTPALGAPGRAATSTRAGRG